jgi:aryl-alcohol dehydrogenase-like predicted oxidoreductase
MVIATKYTSAFKQKSHPHLQQSNFGGNSAKSLRLSLESSLEKLQTSYVDILYVHYWDMTASIPEIMQSLNHLVATGKVIYLGISDTPAWIVAKCNAYAREHGLRPFSIYQGRWSAADRDFERDIIPMCRDEGMALAPWGVLGRGLFRSGNAPKEGGRNAPSLNNGREGPVSKVLSSVAATKGVPITNIALAYVQHKAPYVFPICGGRTVAHLRGNIEALGVTLSNEDITEIESGYDFDLGFPHNFLSATGSAPEGPEDISISNRRGTFEYVKSGYQITGAS